VAGAIPAMPERRPVIAISCYLEPASQGDWTDVPSALVPHDYVRQVERAGGLVVLVPPRVDADDALAAEVLDRIDGLILAGGADVEASRYGAEPHLSVQGARRDRDEFELALARVSAARDMPVLGICRGMQVMAVAAGGELEQHVPDRVGHHGHSLGQGRYAVHTVATVEGTLTAQLLGPAVEVPTYHHQSVLSHPGFVPSAWADDGTLEAMEDPGASFRVGVQWHPEVGTDPRLFHALVAAAIRSAD
jgi:putative glutamine amidotransferase